MGVFRALRTKVFYCKSNSVCGNLSFSGLQYLASIFLFTRLFIASNLASPMLQPGMWKRKLEAVKGYRFASTLTIHIERQNLIEVLFVKKYRTKSECLIDHHLQRNIFKGLSRTAPTPINSNTNLAINRLFFKIIRVQNSLF